MNLDIIQNMYTEFVKNEPRRRKNNPEIIKNSRKYNMVDIESHVWVGLSTFQRIYGHTVQQQNETSPIHA